MKENWYLFTTIPVARGNFNLDGSALSESIYDNGSYLKNWTAPASERRYMGIAQRFTFLVLKMKLMTKRWKGCLIPEMNRLTQKKLKLRMITETAGEDFAIVIPPPS
jgi:hypothetical protein